MQSKKLLELNLFYFFLFKYIKKSTHLFFIIIVINHNCLLRVLKMRNLFLFLKHAEIHDFNYKKC